MAAPKITADDLRQIEAEGLKDEERKGLAATEWRGHYPGGLLAKLWIRREDGFTYWNLSVVRFGGPNPRSLGEEFNHGTVREALDGIVRLVEKA